MADVSPDQGRVLHGHKLSPPSSTDDILQGLDRAFERFCQQLEAKMLPSQPKPWWSLHN
ncbi:Hypothetical predicted protein, partial [Pelobates cultripes]